MPADCCMKPQNSPPPPCCSTKSYDKSDDSWRPNAESSMIDNEQFPEMSLLGDTPNEIGMRTGETEDVTFGSNEYGDIDHSNAISNKQGTFVKEQGKGNDISVIYSPLAPPRGTFSQSTSFRSSPTRTRTTEGYSADTFNESRDYTDLGPWKNFQIPANIPRNVPAGTHKSFPRTKVPRPSRNYSSYEDPQQMLDVKEIAEYWKKLPRYYSTPKTPGAAPWQGMDESSLWGQDLSSFDPTNDSPWSQGVRMDSFNVIKYMTPSPKNVKVPPRLNQSYAVTADHRRMAPVPGKAYQSQPRPTGPHYSYVDRSYGTEPSQAGGTFTQRPPSANLTRIQQQYTQPLAPQPTSARLQSTFVQRPQSAQGYSTRPNLTQDIYSSRLNSTMEGRSQSAQVYNQDYSPQQDSRTQRPRTADTTTEGSPQSVQTYNLDYSPQPDLPSQRPRTADITTDRRLQSEQVYNINYLPQLDSQSQQARTPFGLSQSPERDDLNKTCDIYRPSSDTNQFNQYPGQTGQELAAMGEFQNVAQNFDTLLEIRTPRVPGGYQSNSPMHLSINVTCTERSLLITPEKRYTMLESAPESPSSPCPGARNKPNKNSNCCQCP